MRAPSLSFAARTIHGASAVLAFSILAHAAAS
jgi:hypothetical protein